MTVAGGFRRRLIVMASGALVCLGSMTGLADEVDARPGLPDPLTLEAALSAIDPDHPLIATARAEESAAAAQRARAAAGDDMRLDLALEARRVEPYADSLYQDHDDSHAFVRLRKTLYDFGRTRQGVAAGEKLRRAREILVRHSEQQLRLDIMRRFFDVLLADLEAARANEAMSIAFVRLDNARKRFKLGELSDIEVLRLQTRYQSDLLERTRAEDRQRQTRAKLALALNRPEDLPSELETPELPGLKNPLPDYDVILKALYRNNLTLAALQLEHQSVVAAVEAAKARGRPDLYVQLQADAWRREIGLRRPFSAVLGLDVPLYRGDRTNAAVAEEKAALVRLDAEIRQTRFRLRQQLLEVWQSIETLQKQLHQARVQRDFRDLDLDRSRARYELEMDANLGDAMSLQSAARKFEAKTRFDLALARERLAQLVQNPAYSALQPSTETPP